MNHTADIGIVARGSSINQAFANAAKGLFSLITNLVDVTETERREIEVSADDIESLLVAWLNELIYLFDVENILFKRFEIMQLSDTRLKATAFGEKVDRTRHTIKLGIKATTYNMLEIDRKNNRLQVVFDI